MPFVTVVANSEVCRVISAEISFCVICDFFAVRVRVCNGRYRCATHFADLQSRIAFGPKDLFGAEEYAGVTIADAISVARGAVLRRWITASLNVLPGEILRGVSLRKYTVLHVSHTLEYNESRNTAMYLGGFFFRAQERRNHVFCNLLRSC